VKLQNRIFRLEQWICIQLTKGCKSVSKLILSIGLTHLKYKIKYIRHCDWCSILDIWRFNAIKFSVQPR